VRNRLTSISTVLVLLVGLVAGSIAVSSSADANLGHAFSIANQASPEGSGGATQDVTMTITVSQAPDVGEEIAVDWATSDAPPSTATSGSTPILFPEDYESKVGTVTFMALETSKTIPMTISQDNADESNETFLVNLFNARTEACDLACAESSTSISDSQGVFTINDDDALPALSINNRTLPEGDAGTTAFLFTTTRTGGSDKSVTVDYASADNSATIANNDYQVATGTLTFTPSDGNQTQSFTINGVGDTTFEPTENFRADLSDPTNASISDNQGVGTLTNDDPTPDPTASIGDATADEGDSLSFPITLSSPPGIGKTATVDFQTSGGTATSGEDYPPTTGSVTFGAGESVRPAVVPTTEDTLDEANETVTVVLSKPAVCCTGAYNYEIGDGEGVGTITDDDAASASLAIDDVTVTEGNTGSVTATFTVTKTGTTGQDVTVDFATANDSATAGADYGAANGTLTFLPAEATKTIAVDVLGDLLDEPNETFFVNLSGAVNGSISDNQGLGTITDDDAATASLAIGNATVTEGNAGMTVATFTVTKTGATGQTVTVDYATANNTAVAPADYVTETGELTFAPADATKSITIDVVGDVVDEPNEGFFVNLSGATDASVSDAQGVGTITDDDLALAPATELTHDFDNDGYADAAFGIPGESMGSVGKAGAVTVIYGTASGLVASRSNPNQTWHLNVADVEGSISANDRFGSSLAYANFNGDNFDDLAIGIPGKGSDAGAVTVLYGSASGLSSAENQLVSQETPDVEDVGEAGDGFGSALTAGDFDNDGFFDLAVGVPGENVNGAGSGAVNVIYGSEGGLTAVGDEIWHQDSSGIAGAAAANDRFGGAVAAGDVNGDGADELIVGALGEDVGTAGDAGVAHVIYGSPTGLSSDGSQVWDQDSTGVEDAAEAGDNFGASVTAGDTDEDGLADVVFGVPREDIGSIANAGGANVLYGSAAGLDAAGDQFWSQDTLGIEGGSEANDLFAFALHLGDFDADGALDLAAGVPGEAVGTKVLSGAANVVYGSASGLTATGDQLWFQDVAGVVGTSERNDLFGSAVSSGDFDNNGSSDLVVGVPGEDLAGARKVNAGVAAALYGSGAGLTATDDEQWHEDAPGVTGSSERNDFFGVAVQ
jgi:hypothetical protein